MRPHEGSAGDSHKLRAVVFDLDGTLLNSLDDIADTANIVLSEHGFPGHTVDAYRYFVGDGVATLFHRALPEPERKPAMEAACVARFKDVYAERWNIKTEPYAGIPEMLGTLAGMGVPLAVLSNKPHDATVRCVRELLPGISFVVVMGQQPDIPRKPDPTGARLIADRLRVPPESVLYLGDTATDMDTAVAAKMLPVGVLWGFRTADELRRHGARALLSHPREVVEIMSRGGLPG